MTNTTLNDSEVQSLRALAASGAARDAAQATVAARAAERGRLVRKMLADVTQHQALAQEKGDAAKKQRAEVERIQAELNAANARLAGLNREAFEAQNLVEIAHQQARVQLRPLGGDAIVACLARVLAAEARNRASLTYRPTFDRLGHQTDARPSDQAQVNKAEQLRLLAIEVANLEFSLLGPDAIEQRCREIDALVDGPAPATH